MKTSHSARVVWFTGLSGSGKSTISSTLKDVLLKKDFAVEILDGDVVRSTLHVHLGFTHDDILENNRLIVSLCKKDLPKCDFILVPVITPFEESRVYARKELGKAYTEVYVKASLEACVERDVKGLYKKAMKGEIPHFIGVSEDTPYEEPRHPDLILDTTKLSIGECIDALLSYLEVPE